MGWKDDFFELFMNGEKENADKLKKQKIPKKLFKYQKKLYEDSVKKNKLKFSSPFEFNDPFDCRGVYWNEELENYIRSKMEADILKEVSPGFLLSSLIEEHVKLIKITCFSEDLFSMPMWAHYADNHQGICIEYDFSSLENKSLFSKHLYPVYYGNERFDITGSMKNLFSGNKEIINYFILLMLIKHRSWEYEKEWRMILLNSYQETDLVNMPVKPTAIYLGLNFDYGSNKGDIIEISDKLGCPIYSMYLRNSKHFVFDYEKIKVTS